MADQLPNGQTNRHRRMRPSGLPFRSTTGNGNFPRLGFRNRATYLIEDINPFMQTSSPIKPTIVFSVSSGGRSKRFCLSDKTLSSVEFSISPRFDFPTTANRGLTSQDIAALKGFYKLLSDPNLDGVKFGDEQRGYSEEEYKAEARERGGTLRSLSYGNREALQKMLATEINRLVEEKARQIGLRLDVLATDYLPGQIPVGKIGAFRRFEEAYTSARSI